VAIVLAGPAGFGLSVAARCRQVGFVSEIGANAATLATDGMDPAALALGLLSLLLMGP
jgi:hypothetical protein